MNADDETDFRPPIELAANLIAKASTEAPESSGTTSDTDNYFRPRIIRDRHFPGPIGDFSPEDLEGDEFFEPTIVREENIKSDGKIAALFANEPDCPILLSDLIQALNSID